MALKGFLALVDDKLSEAFHYVAPDKTKHRKPFLSALDKAAKQFDEGKQPRGANALWSANNNTVRFMPKLAGVPVMIEGKSEFFIPAERFPNALAELRKDVEAGELDETLHNASKGKSDPLAGGVKLTSHAITPKPKRAGWSPERRARFAESVAARKAAKDS
ncbi:MULTISPECIES: hypothetical protein [Sphingomonas]|uniref:hypothetical protein n=1 Tax=Sphingomonas TaxID=13687 RepID=UPI000F7E929E|nr:hypothetical protein [Sphingomonas sp. ABOLF]RSV14615.1 hypothetical protein CA235_11085 [Sphingomonas sp. ABOLF]GLK19214.1 hypothetical protein GCM10017606_00400 [Microbacterium terregens]